MLSFPHAVPLFCFYKHLGRVLRCLAPLAQLGTCSKIGHFAEIALFWFLWRRRVRGGEAALFSVFLSRDYAQSNAVPVPRVHPFSPLPFPGSLRWAVHQAGH
ncbi:unnamed protein product [Bursaphelenchus xylophilus]|uniref:(pine wood nematode) hypothetical protein n=1 Tax=Bursaphelenchus xylophilus TaxID=6326 RepID=A0A1I7SSE4_BURXY|nr:unnamed protein product [Bursaphelenchus xylophilus]CAG9097657.1 unnamed protein product [Bursaphelenchus xylophilus]